MRTKLNRRDISNFLITGIPWTLSVFIYFITNLYLWQTGIIGSLPLISCKHQCLVHAHDTYWLYAEDVIFPRVIFS